MYNDLRCHQYDALDFDVNLTKDDGTAYVLETDESIWCCIKQSEGGEPLYYETQTELHFKIDKVEFPCGEFLVETGINFADETTRTLTHSKLIVMPRLRGEDE